VTWFTFLPSFLFILAGGPLVESTHGDLKFTAPLTAHHRRGGRRDPQPGAVLRLPRAVAAGATNCPAVSSTSAEQAA
jgi:hypothetical protein